MFIKKQIVLVLSFLVLFVNSGMAFTIHFCHDNIASVSINSNGQNTEKDCCEAIEKEAKCCKNKEVKLPVKIDQIAAKLFSFSPDFIFDLYQWEPSFFKQQTLFKNGKITTYFCDANAPPLYLLYSQYTFYS